MQSSHIGRILVLLSQQDTPSARSLRISEGESTGLGTTLRALKKSNYTIMHLSPSSMMRISRTWTRLTTTKLHATLVVCSYPTVDCCMLRILGRSLLVGRHACRRAFPPSVRPSRPWLVTMFVPSNSMENIALWLQEGAEPKTGSL